MRSILFSTTPADPRDYLPVPPRYPSLNVDRVNRGIALMDQKYPHWWRVLDLDTLDLRSTKNCVLGQVAGDYLDGLMTVLGGYSDYVQYQLAVDNGFDATNMGDCLHVQALWTHEVGERQAKLLENTKEEAHA
jgi:hypothetical protein